MMQEAMKSVTLDDGNPSKRRRGTKGMKDKERIVQEVEVCVE